MVTLISVHNSEGLVGRCDARCHDAQESDCGCICGGRNHGVGLEQATDNTRELVDEWAARAERDGLTLRQGEPVAQGTLPLGVA